MNKETVYTPNPDFKAREIAKEISPDIASKDNKRISINLSTAIYVPLWKVEKFGEQHFIDLYKESLARNRSLR